MILKLKLQTGQSKRFEIDFPGEGGTGDAVRVAGLTGDLSALRSFMGESLAPCFDFGEENSESCPMSDK